MAQGRTAGHAATAVRRAGLDGARLDLPDASQDSALTTSRCAPSRTWTRRSARSGGCSGPEAGCTSSSTVSRPTPGVVRWQQRLQPLQGALFAGCRLDRPIATLVRAAGFEIGDLATFYAPGLRPMSYVYLGWATAG